ncbi:MAG: 2-C-methyl-D-erythritol 4-phosphate cytidylyltransferase [Bacteroidales bacterium]|nr:2-C-methyl-D-erythritol 4-phosphate cytidylyltransferase [Bacteroidales bacterium]MCF8455225.1 2-C-methyl-D-erythritol 4-phosphate cytidylyltransferase [Bacteroidales bacterium]
MKKNVVIVAGGSGTRMQSYIPKQFLVLGNMPVLMHSMEAFYKYNPNINMVLALPESQFDFWRKLCTEYQFSIPHNLTPGGETRFQSVQNALKLISEGLVAIHDGVRPLVSQSTIRLVFQKADELGNAVPITNMNDSVRIVNSGGHAAFNRDQIKIVQTPQVFRTDEIKSAYQQTYIPAFTDDATVMEAYGKEVFLVDGNPENLKITTPGDLLIAEALLKTLKV